MGRRITLRDLAVCIAVNAVRIFDIFENILKMKDNFTENLKESC